MTSKFDRLTEVDIEKIRKLVEILDKSTFDHLTLEMDDFKLIVATGTEATLPSPAFAQTAAPPSPATSAAMTVATPAKAPVAEGLIDITAPTMGHFYSRPDPNSEPYVSLGSRVGTESTVGLLEIMKLFNSVTAGTDGVVEQICVVDADLVEYGQVLMRVRPSA